MSDEATKRTILIEVGEHQCLTCTRCSTTFARVHPACPSCSQEFRARAENERLRKVVESIPLPSTDDAGVYFDLYERAQTALVPADEAKR